MTSSTGDAADLNSDSCISAATCVAVGLYQDKASDNPALIETRSAGLWTAAEAPKPPGYSSHGDLDEVSCASDGTCAAVGSYETSNQTGHWDIDTLSSGAWTSINAPVPSNFSTFGALNSVSCSSGGTCAAVGYYYDSAGNLHGLLDTLSSEKWSATESPEPPGFVNSPGYGSISSVSCYAPGSCIAVGSYEDSGGHSQAVIEALTSGSWSAQEVSGGGTTAALVSCASDGTCAVVGLPEGQIETLSGGGWELTPAPTPTALESGSTAALDAVSCSPGGGCVAVGSYHSASLGSQWLTESLSGGTWSAATPPQPADSLPGPIFGLSSVSCSSARSCVAVGTYEPSTGTGVYYPSVSTIESLTADTWTTAQLPAPANATTDTSDNGADSPTLSFGAVPNSVSCSIDGSCTLVGSYPAGKQVGIGYGNVTGLIDTYNVSGYWLVASDGGVFTVGDAGFYGSAGSEKLSKPIVGMAATPSGKGYWLVASDGGIFTYGDAGYCGSAATEALSKPIVGMAATPSGKGYWLVASDGGIFTFGDAGYYGSAGAEKLNRPIVGMAATPSGKGYWLVASDGGIFAYGDAPYLGSTGAERLNKPIVSMESTQDGGGYWLVATDGGIFTFGNAPFVGSEGGVTLNKPVVGMAS